MQATPNVIRAAAKPFLTPRMEHNFSSDCASMAMQIGRLSLAAMSVKTMLFPCCYVRNHCGLKWSAFGNHGSLYGRPNEEARSTVGRTLLCFGLTFPLTFCIANSNDLASVHPDALHGSTALSFALPFTFTFCTAGCNEEASGHPGTPYDYTVMCSGLVSCTAGSIEAVSEHPGALLATEVKWLQGMFLELFAAVQDCVLPLLSLLLSAP
eukprot:1158297-Pelagomonas_calceolata.AAC.8